MCRIWGRTAVMNVAIFWGIAPWSRIWTDFPSQKMTTVLWLALERSQASSSGRQLLNRDISLTFAWSWTIEISYSLNQESRVSGSRFEPTANNLLSSLVQKSGIRWTGTRAAVTSPYVRHEANNLAGRTVSSYISPMSELITSMGMTRLSPWTSFGLKPLKSSQSHLFALSVAHLLQKHGLVRHEVSILMQMTF
jgi:hypothetical protein